MGWDAKLNVHGRPESSLLSRLILLTLAAMRTSIRARGHTGRAFAPEATISGRPWSTLPTKTSAFLVLCTFHRRVDTPGVAPELAAVDHQADLIDAR